MNILFASSEVVPFSKTGGLADVAGALPPALAAAGNQVTVITPRYGFIDPVKFKLRALPDTMSLHIGLESYHVSFFEGSLDHKVKVIFTDCPPLFGRDKPYGTSAGDYPDNGIRFGLFAKAIAEWADRAATPFNILHLNDWQTAMAPLFLRGDGRADNGSGTNSDPHPYPGHPRPKVVFTIHNLGYHGLFNPEILPELGLGWEHFNMFNLEFWGQVSFIKAGLIHADLLTTVSQTYSKEIQTEEFGFGLDGVLRSRADKLTGVVNGVDYRVWNPETDEHIIARYSAKNLTGKAACKRDLQRELALPQRPRTPVIGMVSRLASQKGFDILVRALDQLLESNLQLVILGNGDKSFEELLYNKSGEDRYRDKMAVTLAFNNKMAHKIEAGADMLLMPSRYEPCGLNQLYSLKYGTVPIVRATGGLEDTVEEFDAKTGLGTGFKFKEYTPDALLGAVNKALQIYRSRNKATWNALMLNGMNTDFSWNHSARVYQKLYEDLLG